MADGPTWGLGSDRLQPQVLGVDFALIVRLGHDRGVEGHVADVADLQPVRVSVVAVLLGRHTRTEPSVLLQDFLINTSSSEVTLESKFTNDRASKDPLIYEFF